MLKLLLDPRASPYIHIWKSKFLFHAGLSLSMWVCCLYPHKGWLWCNVSVIETVMWLPEQFTTSFSCLGYNTCYATTVLLLQWKAIKSGLSIFKEKMFHYSRQHSGPGALPSSAVVSLSVVDIVKLFKFLLYVISGYSRLAISSYVVCSTRLGYRY